MAARKSEPQYEVLWPLAEKAVQAGGAAPRLADLSGKTVAELWLAKFRGEIIYPMVRTYLKAHYPGIRIVEHTEFGNFFGPKETEVLGGLPEKLRQLGCDAVIVGVGA
jgi:hypothetical protein